MGKEKDGVYFVETKDGRFVKIGYSTQVHRRIWQLGTLRPGNFELRLIGWMPGSLATEQWLHKKFAADRDNGEWFRSTPGLRQFIEVLGLLRADCESPAPVVHEAIPQPVVHELREAKLANPNPAAVALGRLGGRKKVPKGAATLTPAERSAFARKGATARWAKAKKKGKG